VEDGVSPTVLPEREPQDILIAPSTIEWWMTQPLLLVEIDGIIHDFVVDTGVTVCLVKPFVSRNTVNMLCRLGEFQARIW
jgi:hypothetical protein